MENPRNPMWHVGYAVKNFLKEGYKSVNEIAKILDVSRQALYGMYGNEEWDKIYIDRLKAAGIKIPGVTEEAPGSNIGNLAVSNKPIGATILHVPIEAEAGFAGGEVDPVYNQDLKQWTLPGFDDDGYSFRVSGESMFPTFKPGEIVVTGTKQEPYDHIKREYVYVVVTGENILVKRLNKKGDGILQLISDNSDFKTTEMNYDSVKVYRARRNVSWDLSKKYSK